MDLAGKRKYTKITKKVQVQNNNNNNAPTYTNYLLNMERTKYVIPTVSVL